VSFTAFGNWKNGLCRRFDGIVFLRHISTKWLYLSALLLHSNCVERIEIQNILKEFELEVKRKERRA